MIISFNARELLNQKRNIKTWLCSISFMEFKYIQPYYIFVCVHFFFSIVFKFKFAIIYYIQSAISAHYIYL